MYTEEKADILKSRARSLARVRRGAEKEDCLEAVAFRLVYEHYAIELRYIREVYPIRSLVQLPGTPVFVRGIMNVRGRILSVIDLKRFFGLPEKGLSGLSKVIILHSPVLEFGLLADEILGTKSVPVKALEPSLPTLTGNRAEYLRGITGDRLVVLDGGRLLADEKLLVK